MIGTPWAVFWAAVVAALGGSFSIGSLAAFWAEPDFGTALVELVVGALVFGLTVFGVVDLLTP